MPSLPVQNGFNSQPSISSSNAAKPIPRDARLIALILASMGAEDAEEGVVHMLLEFAHRYTSEVLSDALVYVEHAGKQSGSSVAASTPGMEDVRLAIQAKVDHSMSSALPKEFLLSLSSSLNRIPLPPIPERYGVRLPAQEDRLTAVNFDIVPRRPSTENGVGTTEAGVRATMYGNVGNGGEHVIGRDTVSGESGGREAMADQDQNEEDEDEDEDDDLFDEVEAPGGNGADTGAGADAGDEAANTGKRKLDDADIGEDDDYD